MANLRANELRMRELACLLKVGRMGSVVSTLYKGSTGQGKHGLGTKTKWPPPPLGRVPRLTSTMGGATWGHGCINIHPLFL
jgi:hypothetical protein